MLDRAACERRVYRLAVLLTGDPVAATGVIAKVVGSQPDLAQLDSAHMDRLSVLRSREIRPAALVSDVVPPKTAEALAGLTAQQREAWVFARVYQTPPREMSRAMDCSSTAADRHLQLADAAMRRALGGDADAAAQRFREYSMTLDVPAFYREAQRRRRHMRLAVRLAIAAVIALLLGALAVWWSRPFDGRSPSGPAHAAGDSHTQTAPAR